MRITCIGLKKYNEEQTTECFIQTAGDYSDYRLSLPASCLRLALLQGRFFQNAGWFFIFMVSGICQGPFGRFVPGNVVGFRWQIRLCYVPSNQNTGWSAPGYDTSLVKEFWNSYLDDVASFHSYSNSTKLKAADLLELRSAQLDAFFVANHEEIIEFFRQMERREEQLSSNEMTGVESLKGQGAKLDGEVNSTRAGYLNSIDMIWAGVERDLNSFGAGEVLELGELNGPAISSSQIA